MPTKSPKPTVVIVIAVMYNASSMVTRSSEYPEPGSPDEDHRKYKPNDIKELSGNKLEKHGSL
jgi:hypothetical protein